MCNSSSNIVVVVVVAVPWHNNNVAFFCRVFSQSETFRSEKEIILRELIFFQQFFERFEEKIKILRLLTPSRGARRSVVGN